MSDKRLTQLANLANVPNDAILYVVHNGESFHTTKAQLFASFQNRINAVSTIVHTGDTTVFGADFSWTINGVNYTNPGTISKTLTAAATGYKKVAIGVLNTSNGIDIEYGDEVLIGETMVQPATPVNKLFLTRWDIIESLVSTPTAPIVGDDYVQKEEFAIKNVTGTGAINLVLDSVQSQFNLVSDAITQVDGCSPTSTFINTILRGQQVTTIWNSSTTNKTLKHSTSANCFRFPGGEDYILKPNEVVEFRWVKTNVLFLQYMQSNISAGGTTPNLSQVLNIGGREVRDADGDGETILELDDRTKIINNFDADDNFVLPAGLFPVGSEIQIANLSECFLFGLENSSEEGIFPEVNGIQIDEETNYLTLPFGIITLRCIYYGEFTGERWTATVEPFEFNKTALGLDQVDNTADADKPVSTAQQIAIDLAEENAINFFKNAVFKQPVFAVIDVNYDLTGNAPHEGYNFLPGQRCLFNAQTDGVQKGIYVKNTGSGWTRADDMPVGSSARNLYIPVVGLSYGSSNFYSLNSGIVGTNNLSFTCLAIRFKNEIGSVLLNGGYAEIIETSSGHKITLTPNILNFLRGSYNFNLIPPASVDANTNVEFQAKSGIVALLSDIQSTDFMLLRSNYRLTNTTVLQKLFDVGASNDGSFKALANTTYKFFAKIELTGLQAAGKTISFGFLGSAGISSVSYTAFAAIGTLNAATTTTIVNSTITSAQTISSSSGSTEAKFTVEGIITITDAGKIYPSGGITNANGTMDVKIGSWFDIYPIGNETVTHSSNID